MSQNFLSWALKVLPESSSFYNYNEGSELKLLKKWFNDKVELIKSKNNYDGSYYDSLNLDFYIEYFSIIKQIGLQNEFELETNIDNIKLRGSFIKSLLIDSENKNKVIVFCHGVSNNRWSLFYCIHIAIQAGYNALIYDARNHGNSDKSYTTLGKVESDDLENVLEWLIRNYKPISIGLYGFSMGASTVLHWIGKFQNKHPEVKSVFCEAPFDDFKKRFSSAINKVNKDKEDVKILNDANKKIGYFDKVKLQFFYGLAMKVMKAPFSLYDVKPILFLPSILNLNLMIMHGTKDDVIDCDASLEIWKKLVCKNKNKVELILVKDASHGDLPFLGDFSKGKLLNNNGEPIYETFSYILLDFFGKNL
ncbi:MAG TPA: alpha/beta fold hydrolase [Mycoplasmatales bacterium]|jgi:alpha-beta hydrolase superfamily lysophospholipase|nr:alpha/beta fold hydrolase [Mycoplasmatales bacterium]